MAEEDLAQQDLRQNVSDILLAVDLDDAERASRAAVLLHEASATSEVERALERGLVGGDGDHRSAGELLSTKA